MSGRGVTCKAPLAHLQEEGSGRSKRSPKAILQCTHSLEEQFCEVKPFAAPSVDACASGEDLSSWEASGYYASVRLFQRNVGRSTGRRGSCSASSSWFGPAWCCS